MAIRHRAFRELENWRIDMNSAGIALLIGARIGQQGLERLTDDRRAPYLPEVYPDIQDVARFNVQAGDAAGQVAGDTTIESKRGGTVGEFP